MILNRLIGPNGFRRNLYDADLIWVVRMLDGEASTDPAKAVEWKAILWTMANRWAGCRYGCDDTYTEFIRRFSRAINPHWWPEEGMNPRLNHPLAWYEARFPWVVDVARRFLAGKIPNNYVGWTNYGAPTDPGVTQGSMRVVAPGLPAENVSWFYVEPYAAGWGSGTVRMELEPHGLRSAALGAGLAVLAVGAFVGVRKWAADRGKTHTASHRGRRGGMWLFGR